jgi:hypothetical protein
MPVANGGCQRRPGGVSHGIHLNSAIEQEPDDVIVPRARCLVQGCATIVGCHRRNGPCLKKEAHSIRVTAGRRVDERRVSILPPSIHVRSFSEQPLDACDISPARCSEHQFVMRASHECPAPASVTLQESRPRPREIASNITSPFMTNIAPIEDLVDKPPIRPCRGKHAVLYGESSLVILETHIV